MKEGKSNNLTAWAVAAAAALGIAGFWYWSPFLAMHQMADAAKSQDAETFNEYVDYPRMRESLKGQFQARMAATMSPSSQDNPFAGLGTMLSMALVNQMVDAMVRPEFVMKAMQEGKVRLEREQAREPGSANAGAAGTADARKQPKLVHDRKGVNKLVTYVVDPEHPEAPRTQQASLVFERSGFATWKLTELRLPEAP